MEGEWIRRVKKPMLGAAALVLAWGVLGGIQMRSTGQGGYSTGLAATVMWLEEKGPAELGGLAVGDRITAVDGVPVKNPWSRPDRYGLEGGAQQSLSVDRAGTTQTAHVTWGPRSPAQWRSLLLDFVVTASVLDQQTVLDAPHPVDEGDGPRRGDPGRVHRGPDRRLDPDVHPGRLLPLVSDLDRALVLRRPGVEPDPGLLLSHERQESIAWARRVRSANRRTRPGC